MRAIYLLPLVGLCVASAGFAGCAQLQADLQSAQSTAPAAITAICSNAPILDVGFQTVVAADPKLVPAKLVNDEAAGYAALMAVCQSWNPAVPVNAQAVLVGLTQAYAAFTKTVAAAHKAAAAPATASAQSQGAPSAASAADISKALKGV